MISIPSKMAQGIQYSYTNLGIWHRSYH